MEQVPAIAFSPAPRRTKTAAVVIDYAVEAAVDDEEGEILRAVMTQAFDNKPKVLADSIWKSSRIVPPKVCRCLPLQPCAHTPMHAYAPLNMPPALPLPALTCARNGRGAAGGTECEGRLQLGHQLAAKEAC